MRRPLCRLESRLEEGQQRRLLLIRGGEVAGPGDFVQAESRDASSPSVLGEGVGVTAPFCDRQPDALARRARQLARAQLGAQTRVAAESRGGLGENADELGDGTPGRLDALDQGGASIRRRELVVDVEAAYVCLYRHSSRLPPFTGALLYF